MERSWGAFGVILGWSRAVLDPLGSSWSGLGLSGVVLERSCIALAFQKEKTSYGDPTIKFQEQKKGSRALATLACASLRLFFKKKKPLMATPLRKGERTKNQIFEKKFRFLRQRHRFHGGKTESGPRYGNVTDWAKIGRFAMRFRDFAYFSRSV